MKKYLINIETNIGKVRRENEDNFFCNGTFRDLNSQQNQSSEYIFGDDNLVFAVFDGMGGLHCGKEASYIATAGLNDYIDNESEAEKFDGVKAIHRLNRIMCEKKEKLNKKMGSTAVILTCSLSTGQIFNIGDSRAYLFRNDKLRQLSVDHTEEIAMNKFFQASGIKSGKISNKLKHVLTQHLGIDDEDFIIEPYASEKFNLKTGDICLLCSDGLTNMLSDTQIENILSKRGKLSKKSKQLLNMALELGGKDNITFILIEVRK